jgi:ABC-2 type transport system permease protein
VAQRLHRYTAVGGLRGLFIGPSLEALVGMDGEIRSGRSDFTLLRPLNVQFIANFRHWRPLALVDLRLGSGLLLVAITQLERSLTATQLMGFLIAISAAVAILYATLLAFSGLVFWSPGILFTWVFDGIFQPARYPTGIYPWWLRFTPTWVIPVGVMTTVPARALI